MRTHQDREDAKREALVRNAAIRARALGRGTVALTPIEYRQVQQGIFKRFWRRLAAWF